jgi:Cd2+/Zn2+-exporting ATPase
MTMLQSLKLPSPSGRFDWSALVKDHSDALAAAICAVLLALGWGLHQADMPALELPMLAAAYIIGGYESTKEGLTTLFEEKELDVDLLMIVAALGAAGLGLWQQDYTLIIDGAVLILIFAISGALEGFATQQTERNIRDLMAATPDVARVIQGQHEQQIAVNHVKVGDVVLVKPGELIPLDGRVVEGNSAVNQAPITGEAMPMDKAIGDNVFAGSLNGNGVLRIQVNKPPESSLIQRVIRLVEEAQTSEPPSQQFVERFERGYARFIVVSGILLAVLPPFLLGWDWRTTIYRALIFLVVASPCALVASIMPALLSGIASGARQGILFKNGAQLETIGQVKAVAFDKTGTLTTGELQVVRVHPAEGKTADWLLQMAASVEAASEHPIGVAISQSATAQNLPLLPATNIQAKSGQGIRGTVAGQQVVVGKAEFIQEALIPSPSLWGEGSQIIPLARGEGLATTLVWVAVDGEIAGEIALADTLRPEARNIVQNLKDQGIEHIVMLTGDNPETAQAIAHELGIQEVCAELLPEQKLTAIRDLQATYGKVAMVGDGINDAPALAVADVGIALGGASTDVALETADIILMANSLDKLPQAMGQGKRANRVVKQNIAFALTFIAILLTANFIGGITMPTGVIGHEGSTVLVTLSGLRLLK